MRRNPDVDLRKLERQYRESGSLVDAVQLMASYYRIGDGGSSAALLPVVESLYAAASHKDLGIEAAIITTFLGLGGRSADLCGGSYGTVVCRYDKTIIWDIKRGYPAGTTQSWIDAINGYLVEWAWVDSSPKLFQDILHPTSKEAFRSQQIPGYAIALFHEMHERDSGWIRILWNNISLPQIEEDYRDSHWGGRPIDIMLEDEPICSDYAGPKICTGYLKVASSGGRSSFSESFTKRVPLKIGIPKALKTMEMLANKIYFAEDWQDADKASGTDLYWPT